MIRRKHFNWDGVSMIVARDHCSCQKQCANCFSKDPGLPNAAWGNALMCKIRIFRKIANFLALNN